MGGPDTREFSGTNIAVPNPLGGQLVRGVKKRIQSGEASGWRVCYQRGLPCLACQVLDKKQHLNPRILYGKSLVAGDTILC